MKPMWAVYGAFELEELGNAPIGVARIAGVVDVFVPAECKLLIETGQHLIAGETAIAKFACGPSAKRS